MPMIDMPLEQLKQYKGISPKPADYDEYWERALKELDATIPNPIIKESNFRIPNTKCYDLYFTGTRGGNIHAKLIKPAEIKEKAPALLHFHGYSGASEDWFQYIPFAHMGFVVVGMDVRGQGGKSEDKNPVSGNTLHGHIIRGLDDPDPDNLFFRQVFLDTAQAARVVMEMDDVDETRVGVYGGSQGGALTLACASLVPEIKLAAPVHPFLCDFRRVWEMDMAERAYEELKEYFRSCDPCHEREDEIFTKLGYIDICFRAEKVKAEVMLAGGLMDNVCPPSTWFAAYNRIKSKKSMLLYPDFSHEWLPQIMDKTALFMSQLLK
ncbi:MAG: alpha/beta fold hydrolase [Firmicutes bacterium]|nr:alpha/beta fold hydrolase [Bacillota bacterium]